MNLFACIGKVTKVSSKGKVLKFSLSTWQEKPCLVPCMIFNPTQDDKDYLSSLQSSNLIVWIQGRLINQIVDFQGTKIKTIEVMTYAKSIKEI